MPTASKTEGVELMSQREISSIPSDLAPAAPSYPCSLAQTRFWILEQIQREDPSRNVAVRWRLNGRIRDEALQRAFQSLVDRHEILRTRIIEHDGAPVQEPLAKVICKLSIIDLSQRPEAERESEALALSAADARQLFDLTLAPLIRASLVRLTVDRAIVTLTAHHIVSDGWSMGVLVREFGELAAAFNASKVCTLPELPLQYVDYCLWQQDYLASADSQQERTYWRQHLAGLTYFEVPPDKARFARRTASGRIE